MDDTEETYGSVKEIHHVFDIALLPKYIGSEERAIIKLLNSWKYKYKNELKGILLYYDELKFLSDSGKIIDDQPFVYWKISGKFRVFNAGIGDIIRGKINRFGNQFVGCTLAKCISSTIILPNPLPDDLSPYLKINGEILFRVDSFDIENTFIQGSITEECIRNMKESIHLDSYDGDSVLNESFF